MLNMIARIIYTLLFPKSTLYVDIFGPLVDLSKVEPFSKMSIQGVRFLRVKDLASNLECTENSVNERLVSIFSDTADSKAVIVRDLFLLLGFIRSVFKCSIILHTRIEDKQVFEAVKGCINREFQWTEGLTFLHLPSTFSDIQRVNEFERLKRGHAYLVDDRPRNELSIEEKEFFESYLIPKHIVDQNKDHEDINLQIYSYPNEQVLSEEIGSLINKISNSWVLGMVAALIILILNIALLFVKSADQWDVVFLLPQNPPPTKFIFHRNSDLRDTVSQENFMAEKYVRIDGIRPGKHFIEILSEDTSKLHQTVEFELEGLIFFEFDGVIEKTLCWNCATDRRKQIP